MEKKVVVISLGGSLIVPNKINIEFLNEFKKVLLKNIKKYKFALVCGGGKQQEPIFKDLNNKKQNKKNIFSHYLEYLQPD